MNLTESQKRHLRLFLNDALQDPESAEYENLELDSYIIPEVNAVVIKNLKAKQLIINYTIHGRHNTAIAVEFSPKKLRSLHAQGII